MGCLPEGRLLLILPFSIAVFIVCVAGTGEVILSDNLRQHGLCRNEPYPTLRCITRSPYLIWTINGHEVIFFGNDSQTWKRKAMGVAIKEQCSNEGCESILFLSNSEISDVTVECNDSVSSSRTKRYHRVAGNAITYSYNHEWGKIEGSVQ